MKVDRTRRIPFAATKALQLLTLAGLLLPPVSAGVAVEGAVRLSSAVCQSGAAKERPEPREQQVRLMSRSRRDLTAANKGIVVPRCAEPPCEPVCGDGRCDAGEDCSCRFDCGPCPGCGDGLCSPPEDTESCAVDCWENQPTCTPSCTPGLCGTDGCGGYCRCPFGEICTDGVCATCVSECGAGVECGRDRCGNLCGTCPTGYSCSSGHCVYAAQCGDRTCSAGENCSSCPGDCGACCGNGRIDPIENEYCDGTQGCAWYETCVSCRECVEPVRCGDGRCSDPEKDPISPAYCPGDCGSGGGGGGGGTRPSGCDNDNDGWVTQSECTGSCGGTIVGSYCVID
jgi:hypothetical protein